ncbi:M28 family metallopeptidase [Alteromonas sp. ASW11-130]|uniref:M28 family metallopeptidase n=1 Tax=Alteromonas sp. ASW11-130 TaxID=3015775 RepID=UPI002241B7C7|nr:M28 family metallopeptidase [Alteromonas sp. ASW11-130]MCW8091190.1 M28 family metallopeptidase [Alteromonas sp. ASW11-130]
MLKKILMAALVSTVSFVTTADPLAEQSFIPKVNYIKSHLYFLADDLLEGRDTGSKGHDIASLYIATEFAKYKMKPAGTDGYMQKVPFRKAMLDQKSPKITFTVDGEDTELEYPKDYLTGPDLLNTDSSMQGKMVFVGYGIVADELNHNDYQHLDVEGKIVVMLAGKPQSFPSEEGAHFASGYQKRKYAAERGAIGTVTLSTPLAEKVRPYQSMLSYIHMPKMAWLDESGEPANRFAQLKGSAYLSQPAAKKLFAKAPVTLDEIYAQLDEDKPPKGFALPGDFSLKRKSTHTTINSFNVAGIIEGSDPTLKNEYVVFSAHSDHIGIAKTVKKDNINNGAMDNASGTAIMLETARLFSQMETKPKRSLLFIAVTGEEKGLLGADYFAHNPTVPVESMAANVNLDMPILTYEFADVIAFGAEHSDMQHSVANAARNAGLTLSPDPWPEQALFTRSDHYAFVKQGVPAVFLVPGLKSKNPDVEASKVFGEFLSFHYHKPSDDINQPFNWEAAKTFTRVNAEIGHTLANQEKRTRWNEGDFFGTTFGRK